MKTVLFQEKLKQKKYCKPFYLDRARCTQIIMTCYFRHMNDVFNKVGITVTKENKKDIDRAIHSIVGVEYKNCSATWKEVKKHLAEDETKFVNTLKSRLT